MFMLNGIDRSVVVSALPCCC